MRKKMLVLLIGLVFSLSVSGFALGQQKEAPPKPVMYRLGGTVSAIDAKAGKITLEQHQVKQQRKLTLNVSKKEVKELAGINVGDVVNAWVTGKTVTKIIKVF